MEKRLASHTILGPDMGRSPW